jgi:cytochrome P450
MTGSADQDFNPFAAFDVFAGTTRDPFPDFAYYREHRPVWPGSLGDQSNLPAEFLPKEQWSVYRYEDVSRVFREAKTFDSQGYNSSMGLLFGPTILGMDGAEHRSHRNLVAHAFKERSLQRWEPEFIAPVCHELLDAVVDDGQADLIQALTFEFPTRVIAQILGLPPEDLEMFRRLSIQLIGIGSDMAKGFEASVVLQEYFQILIDARRTAPADDVVSDLVTAVVDGEKLSDEAIYSFLRLLLPAGLETTYRSSGNLLFLLLTHPDQFELLRQDRSLLSQTIEEGLRYEAPLTAVARTATRDVELGDQMINAGATVSPVMASANRDERRWDRSEEFDILREQKPHITFAAGPHMCLGMHLARLETRVALSVLMDRLTNIELDMENDPHIRGFSFRSPTTLPVTFQAV